MRHVVAAFSRAHPLDSRQQLMAPSVTLRFKVARLARWLGSHTAYPFGAHTGNSRIFVQ